MKLMGLLFLILGAILFIKMDKIAPSLRGNRKMEFYVKLFGEKGASTFLKIISAIIVFLGIMIIIKGK